MRSQDDILAIKELEGTVEYLQRHYEDVVEERDAALAERDAALTDAQVEKTRADELNWEFERLSKAASKKIESLEKDLAQAISALHDARLENSGQAARIEELKRHIGEVTEIVRPEPSRLEIAAMAMQGFLASSGWQMDVPALSLKLTDALIKAAKEGK
jgi:chromosome segregation ATPase